MIKISISKNNQVTNQAQFQTQAEADAWLEQEVANKSFGKPAGFYPISQLSPEELAQEISRKEVDGLGNPIEVMVEIPAQYAVSTEDISLAVAQEKVNQDSLKFLQDSDYKVLRHIREKALQVATTLTEAEYLALEQSRLDAAARIVR